MRRIMLFFMLFLGFAFAAVDAECYSVARKLHDLQNRIVTYAFVNLKRGDWALYADGTKAVYLGRKIKSGKELYGIEVQTKMPMQIWYEIIPKDVEYAGHKVRFLTIDPTLFYIRTNMGMIVINKAQIGMYAQMMGGNLSTIFTPAQIKTPPDCTHVPKIIETNYRLSSGISFHAVKIIDRKKGTLIVSERVPFGMVEVADSKGYVHLQIKNFGHGAKILMDEEKFR